MKNKKLIALVILVVLIAATAIAGAQTNEPGSSEDPVVTKSYVDQKIAELKAQSGTSGVFEAINVKAGKKLIGGAGTELILRSGKAYAIDNGADGVSDVTGAKDLAGGVSVSKNHLLLVPRDDGRGINAETELWVMVKGPYTIE